MNRCKGVVLGSRAEFAVYERGFDRREWSQENHLWLCCFPIDKHHLACISEKPVMAKADKYRRMSDEELAEVQHGLLGKSAEDILIEREWRRRDRREQFLWSVLGASVSALLGAIVGWLLKSYS